MNKSEKGDSDIILDLGRVTDCLNCKITMAEVFGYGERWARIA